MNTAKTMYRSRIMAPIIFLYGMMFLLSACSTARKAVEPRTEEPPVARTEEPAENRQPESPPTGAHQEEAPPVFDAATDDSTALIDPRQIPETPREMRAVWVASVANIDWPSEPGLPVAQQKAELRTIMDRAVQLNMNAIILQVRPSADALYNSPHEPWSEYLTGKQGRPPKPYYDPLAFAVEEAHRRGLELHAWFNPFRAYHNAAKTGFAQSHIKNKNPKLVKKYGRYYWLDPGEPEARAYSRKVILDAVRRYDIDGVHLDDYFYPYAQVGADGRDIPFPDSDSYQDYVRQNGSMRRDDWRRQNINRFVKNLYEELHKVKPKIRFGISPFGIWRPGNPPQIKGYDAYARIYADAKKWINNGWVDYIAPQLYWPIDRTAQSFPVLLKWWHGQNTYNRHLWPGLYTSRVGGEWKAEEISNQIKLSRRQEGATGAIHFSVKPLMNNAGDVSGQLLSGVYAQPALVPASHWLSSRRPPQPDATLETIGNKQIITLAADSSEEPWLWVLKSRYGDRWQLDIIPGWIKSKALASDNEDGILKGAVITTVNRVGNESVPQMLLPVLEDVENSERQTLGDEE